MTGDEFLDLSHRWLLEVSEDKENQHHRINTLLIGPLLTMENNERVSIVDERSGMVPPAWWKGDVEASRLSVQAANQMRLPR